MLISFWHLILQFNFCDSQLHITPSADIQWVFYPFLGLAEMFESRGLCHSSYFGSFQSLFLPSLHSFSSLYGTPMIDFLGLWGSFHFLKKSFSHCYPNWIICIGLPSSLLTDFSVIAILLLSLSSKYLILAHIFKF